MPARRAPTTLHLDRQPTTSIGAVVTLLATLLLAFVLLSLFMVRHHAWTEKVTSRLPWPGLRTSLAADSALPAQLRIDSSRAWYTDLADRTPVLVVRADVMNEALIEVDRIVLEGRAVTSDGTTVAVRSGSCGKIVSERLLRRLRKSELRALEELTPGRSAVASPGTVVHCQITFAGIEPGASEVLLRIVSAEPLPGHSPPLFPPSE